MAVAVAVSVAVAVAVLLLIDRNRTSILSIKERRTVTTLPVERPAWRGPSGAARVERQRTGLDVVFRRQQVAIVNVTVLVFHIVLLQREDGSERDSERERERGRERERRNKKKKWARRGTIR